MNYIPQIAKMLGVEIGEEFHIDGNLFKLTENGILKYFNDGHGTEKWTRAEVKTYELLNGEKEFEKMPFEPQQGETYYFVSWVLGEKSEIYTVRNIYSPHIAECVKEKYCGNVFRTEAEAEREKYNVYKRLTGKEWEE